jgi:tetratricopeptide (TPR) repeat protein
MKKQILIAAAGLAMVGMLRADEVAATKAATAVPTPVAKNDAPGSLAPGKALLDAGKYKEAAAYFEGIGEQVAANGATKREPWRLNNWALALLEDGQYDKCIEVAGRLTESHPEMEGGWNKLAAAYARNGKREEAMAIYEKGIERVKAAGGDSSRLEANRDALRAAIEEGKPKAVKTAEAKAREAADKAATKAEQKQKAAAAADK